MTQLGSRTGSRPFMAHQGVQPGRRSMADQRATLVVAAVAMLLVIAGGVVAVHLKGSPPLSGRSAPNLPAGVQPSTAVPPADPASVRVAALDQLLLTREDAVRRHDLTAWLGTVDPQQTAFVRSQRTQFANLVKLPLSRWHYTYQDPGDPLPAARQSALGLDAWVAQVDLGYRFGAADRTDVHTAEALTLVDHGGSWRLAGLHDGKTDTEIWDLGALNVVQGHDSVVIGTGSRSSLEGYATQADSAVRRVSGVWGHGWPQRVVVLVPKTRAQMGQLLDESSDDLAQVAAVTVGELTSGTTAPAGGADQIIINPAGFARLQSVGRTAVLTHETTHVAVRASTPWSVPVWLSEGFADYVGFSGLGLARTDVAADVLSRVRRGTGPQQLPTAADFDPTQATIGPSYSAAWLACSLIADRYGQARLIKLYRVAAGASAATGVSASQSADAHTRAAFPAVLGVSEASFTKTWLHYLQSLAG